MTGSNAAHADRAPRFVTALNPLVRRLVAAGIPAGPNVLLTVTGRRSGLPRTFPVALLRVAGRRFVQSPYGEVDWVRNLRVDPAATLEERGRSIPVTAAELSADEGGRVLRDALEPYLRNRLSARFSRVFVPLPRDASLEDHVEHVRAHPMFELVARVSPASVTPGSSTGA